MPRSQANHDVLLKAWLWIRSTPWLTHWSIIGAVVIVFLCQMLGYHQPFLPWSPSSGDDIFNGWVEPPKWISFLDYVRPYLRLCLMLGSIVFLIQLIRTLPDWRAIVLPLSGLCAGMALNAFLGEIYTNWQEDNSTFSGEPKSGAAFAIKILMIFIVFATPAATAWWYSNRTLLERYTLRNFVQPLVFCFAAFAALMVLMDLIDSLKDYQAADVPISTMLGFYLGLMPFIFVHVAPAAVLLASLYGFTKMSRANEVVSMLTAGRSVVQVVRPVLIVAAIVSVLALAANYYWGPHGEGARAALVRASKDKQSGTTAMSGLMFKSDETARVWFVGRVPFDLLAEKMRNVEVRQFDERGRLAHGWSASAARWWANARMWSFYNGVEITYHLGEATQVTPFPESTSGSRLDVNDWSESPWTLMSGALTPDNLTVPDLVAYLQANEQRPNDKLALFRVQFYERFASPWQSIIIALLAAPLAIAFSRRGALDGIAGAVGAFFGMMFLENMFRSLAKSGRMPPWLAMWMPLLILGSLGLWCLHCKSYNRPIFRVSWKAVWPAIKRWLPART